MKRIYLISALKLLLIARITKLILIVIFFMSGCDDEEDSQQLLKDIVEVADEKGYDRFVDALDKSSLLETLKNDGPFTVFAPTNSALEALGLIEENDFNGLNDAELREILAYHIVSGNFLTGQLPDGELGTIQNEILDIDIGTLMVNDRKIIEPFDLTASNGTIHTLDSLLAFPKIIQTVLVAYTPPASSIAVELSGSIEEHTAEIVQEVNEAYDLSGVNVKLVIADVRFIDFNFTQEVIISNPNATSVTGIRALVDPNDGIVDEIHVWRDEVKADIAILKNDFCGGGAAPCQFNFVSEFLGIEGVDGAFALVGNENCENNPFTFAHEIGHLQGCNHQPGFGATNPQAPYANGYLDEVGRFRTVMATAGKDRVGVFSSPNVFWEGRVTGTVELNDCVRGINESALKISRFR